MRLSGRVLKLRNAMLQLIVCMQDRKHMRIVKLEMEKADRLLAGDRVTGTICRPARDAKRRVSHAF